MYNHEQSFINVLQCLSQPTWHSEADNITCSHSGIKRVPSLWTICLLSFGSAQKAARNFIFLSILFFRIFWGMDLTGRPREQSPKSPDVTRTVTDCAKSLLGSPFVEAHALTIKCPCTWIQESKKKNSVRWEKSDVFSTVSVDGIRRTWRGSMWDQAGARKRRRRGNVWEDSVLLCYFSRFFFCS